MYILWTYQRMMGGPVRKSVTVDQAEPPIRDLDLRQKVVVAPLIIGLLVLGFFPRLALDYINPAVAQSSQQTGQHDPVQTAEEPR